MYVLAQEWRWCERGTDFNRSAHGSAKIQENRGRMLKYISGSRATNEKLGMLPMRDVAGVRCPDHLRASGSLSCLPRRLVWLMTLTKEDLYNDGQGKGAARNLACMDERGERVISICCFHRAIVGKEASYDERSCRRRMEGCRTIEWTRRHRDPRSTLGRRDGWRMPVIYQRFIWEICRGLDISHA
jgi:hypothetical protein